MTPEGLRVLAERADTVVGRPDTRLDELHARIAHARKRRRVGLSGAAVVVLLLALTVGLSLHALTGAEQPVPDKPGPLPTSTPTSTAPVDQQPVVRRLTYARGHRIHWGDSVIDAGQTVQSVHATDDGVVFVRGDKECPYQVACRTLWFSDGADAVRIGTVTGSWIRGFNIWFAAAGSTVVWSEPDQTAVDPADFYPPTREYVVYDTSLRREVGRFGSAQSMVVAVGDDTVYWVPDERQCVDYYGECLRFKAPVMRFDGSTGRQVTVSWASYWAARRSWPRTLMSPQLEEIGDPERVVRPLHADPKLNDSFGFTLEAGGRLVGDDGSVPVTVRVARTGAPLRLRVPPGYPPDAYFAITQWLDDDRVVMNGNEGSLLVCQVPSGRCRPAVKGTGLTSFRGRG